MIRLPIDDFLPAVIASLDAGRNLVLVAEPGAGKTTRVPPAIVDADILSAKNPVVVVLQPRRVAARTVAARIADERRWTLGEQVGYHVRFDRRIGPRTRVRVVTEGILTRQLLDDPFLEGVGCVVLDEFHERSLFTDVAIALLREVQTTVRPDLALIVMSATLAAEPVAAFLGRCPILRVPGRTYPVTVAYAPSTGYPAERVTDAVLGALDSETGDVLAFLPGADDIRRAESALSARTDAMVFPLHGSLPPAEQAAALRPAPPGRRKVVLATNIAETSLTIDGVRTVIDSGLAKIAGYDPDRGMDRLDLRRISRASADQRAGRAGRTGPGRCIRLWAESEPIEPFELPEIRRVDLASTVLSLHAWGKPDVRSFGWFEPPDEPAVASAERLLAMLGALDDRGHLTPIGKTLAAIPAHPRVARLLVAAAACDRLVDGATLAAIASEKDLLLPDRARGPRVAGDSDLVYRMTLLDEAEQARFGPGLFDRGIDPAAARTIAQVRDELVRVSKLFFSGGPTGRVADVENHSPVALRSCRADTSQVPAKNAEHRSPVSTRPVGPPLKMSLDDDDLLKLPLFAYPDRVCRRRTSDPAAGVMVGGRGVRLAAESTVRTGDFFVAVELRHDPRSFKAEAAVKIASAIDSAWLPDVRTERGAEFDLERNKVVGFVRTWYRDLLITDDPHAAVPAEAAGAALDNALRPKARELFEADPDASNVMARVALLRANMPEHPWPVWSDDDLGELLAAHCAGKRTVDEAKRGLAAVLKSDLVYPLDRLLESEAPAALEVPTGNKIGIDYVVGQPPTLAVRLQEVFGWTETPRLAGGRVRVRVQLLGPNFRPVQITDDLRNFWATTYFQVRKDLRARYPKHAWPEDPVSAPAVARGRPRR